MTLQKKVLRTMAGSSPPNERVVPEPNNNDDDDEDDLMDVRLPSGMIFMEDGGGSSEILPATKHKPLQKPEESAMIDDRAILECWNLTVASHERVPTVDPASGEALLSPKNEFKWHAKDKGPPPDDKPSSSDILRAWQPKSLPLPLWAVDPSPASKS